MERVAGGLGVESVNTTADVKKDNQCQYSCAPCADRAVDCSSPAPKVKCSYDSGITFSTVTCKLKNSDGTVSNPGWATKTVNFILGR